MKIFFKVVCCMLFSFMILPLFVKAEEGEAITLICESNSAFKVGTNRICNVTINEVDTEVLFKVELGEGLTARISSINDDYSVELVAGQTYLLEKGTKTTEPAQLDIILSLASDANIDKTGIELKLYKEFSKLLLGDLDDDGMVTELESNRILEAINGTVTLTEQETKIADVDQDGMITARDAELALQMSNNELDALYLYEISNTTIGESSGTILFDVDCTPATQAQQPNEKVEVPNTVSNFSIWIYVIGVLLMAFGVYLIVQSKKVVKE